MIRSFKKIFLIVVCVFLANLSLVSTNVFANEPENQNSNNKSVKTLPNTAEQEDDHGIDGPSYLTLGTKAQFILPENTRFIPSELLGGKKNPGMTNTYFGMIEPKSKAQFWSIYIYYIPSGHIKTTQDITLDVNKLFADMKKQNDATNIYRAKNNERLMEYVGGWEIEPTFDYYAHELRYATLKKFVGSDPTLKYVSILLGREGYFSFELFTGEKEFTEDKKHADSIFSTFQFVDGMRYSNFNSDKDSMVSPFDISSLVTEDQPEINATPDVNAMMFRFQGYMAVAFSIILAMIIISHFMKKLILKKYKKTDLNVSDAGVQQIGLLVKLKEIFTFVKNHRKKYFMLMMSMIILLLSINIMVALFNISKFIYSVLFMFLCLPYYVAIVRLTAFGGYEHFLYILPSVNLRVLRALGWSFIIMLIEFLPLFFAGICYGLGSNHILISPTVGNVAAGSIGLIALYLFIRLAGAIAAVCYDIPSPIKAAWNATKGNVIKMLGAFCVIWLIGYSMTLLNYYITGGKPEELMSPIVFNNPVTYLKVLISTITLLTMQTLIDLFYAVIGLVLFDIRSEQKFNNTISSQI